MQWRVRNVMTTDVITVRDIASVSQIAEMLTLHGISAVPVLDRFDAVVGVVSWKDLTDKIETGDREGSPRHRWFPRPRSPQLRWPKAAAAEVMSAPPVTIRPDTSLAGAGRAMYRRGVGRLLVVDDRDRLVGIVTRTDLLKVHARLDAVIGDEVTQTVLRRTLLLETGAVTAAVDDGVVTLTGRTMRKTTALTAAALTKTVAGVAGVVNGLTFDFDDTLGNDAARPAAGARRERSAAHAVAEAR